ncbi:hypothetical protein GCM10020220_083200 [Nonomuraea rubra]
MMAIGASPGTLRMVVAGQALYIAGLGALVGLPVLATAAALIARTRLLLAPGSCHTGSWSDRDYRRVRGTVQRITQEDPADQKTEVSFCWSPRAALVGEL